MSWLWELLTTTAARVVSLLLVSSMELEIKISVVEWVVELNKIPIIKKMEIRTPLILQDCCMGKETL